MARLPSTFVSESIRNFSLSGVWFLPRSRVNSASPTEAIFPDTDCTLGAGGVVSVVRADSGERQTARVKQRRKKVVNESAVRNRMVEETSRATISAGERRWGKPKAKARGKACNTDNELKNEWDTLGQEAGQEGRDGY